MFVGDEAGSSYRNSSISARIEEAIRYSHLPATETQQKCDQRETFVAAQHGPMTGRIFNNRYQINDRIGIGGMAEVYRAQDNVLGRSVAVKVMLPQYAADPNFTQRFRQEAAAAANLQSPYIVNVYDWGTDDETYYIVMEFVRGSDLKTAIQQRGAINQRKVAEIGMQVCQALTVAHNQDIIHRDIKPQNIMVQPDGNVKVMDFGIARAKNSVAQRTSSVLGTAHYISPEQAQGMELTSASDIYSLGIVLYEAATGTLPFDGPDAVSVALKQVNDFPPLPREVNPDIDPDLETIIMTALEKEPNLRFATANDMRMALADYLAGRPFGSAMAMGAVPGPGFTEAQTRVMPAVIPPPMIDATQTLPALDGTNSGYSGSNSGGGSTYRAGNHGKKKSPAGKIVLIVLLVLALVAGGAFAYFNLAGGATVPDVTGKTLAEATKILEDAGFVAEVTDSVYDANVEEGRVISQVPLGSLKAEEGSKVSLTISQGTEQGTVPDLRNKTVDQAKQIATENGFIMSASTGEYSEDLEPNYIISQQPTSGSRAPKGSVIECVFSLGAESVTVPNVTGKSSGTAQSTITDAKLKVEVTTQKSSEVPEGQVISQNPSSGTRVEAGSTVTIVVSAGAEQVTVPSVVNFPRATATSTLRGAGFEVQVEEQSSPTVTPGYVISQNPSSGTAAEGSTVTIIVSTGPSSSSSSGSTNHFGV